MRFLKSKLAAFSLALIGITLGGCASTPVSNTEAVDVPAKRIVDSTLMQSMANSGKVTIKRDNGFTGSACAKRVFADAKAVADLNTGERLVIYLSEGEHIISAKSNSPCGGGLVETMVTVKAGGNYSYRIGTQSNMGDGIYPTAF